MGRNYSACAPIDERDFPPACCLRCRFFGIDENPKWHRLPNGRRMEGWVSRCDHDPSVTDPAHACASFENRAQYEAAQIRARGGYDRPLEPTAGAIQERLL